MDQFRISLKWLLAALLMLGAGLGLLGRLFYTDREVFRAVVMGLSTAAPFMLAIGTVLWIGVRRRRYGLVAWGGLLVAAPFIGVGVLYLADRAEPPINARALPSNAQRFATDQLLGKLPGQMEEPYVWRELERRVNSGALSREEAERAIEALVAHMKQKKPDGWDQPLHWADGFVQNASAAGLLSDETRIALADAFYGTRPAVQPLPRVRENSPSFNLGVKFGNTWGRTSGIDLALVWDVTAVKIDGEPLDVRQTHHFADDWSGHCAAQLPAGEHELSAEIECAYIARSKLIGLDEHDLPSERWPTPVKRWTATASSPFRVYTDAEPIVALATDPDQDPRRFGAIDVERLVAQAGEQGGAKIVVKLAATPMLPIPVSADVAVRVGGQTLEMGAMWVSRDGSSNLQMEKAIESLDPGVTIADVLLTPNPAPIERRPEVKEIWGAPIELRGERLERLDLEARENSP